MGDTGPLAELKRCGADPAGSAVDQHFVLGTKMAEVVKHVVRRHVGDRGRGCGLEGNPLGERKHALDGRHDETGLTAVAHRCHHLLTDLQALNVLSKGINHPADLVAGRERVGWAGLVKTESHQKVGEVDAGIGHLDSYLTLLWSRRLHGLGGDGRDTTGFLDDDAYAGGHAFTLHAPFS